MKAAAAVPGRVGAGVSFHGGFLVTDKPDSPHLLVPKIRARFYFAIASDDDRREPSAKDRLKEAFASANAPAEIEVFPNALPGGVSPIEKRQRTRTTGSAPGQRLSRCTRLSSTEQVDSLDSRTRRRDFSAQ